MMIRFLDMTGQLVSVQTVKTDTPANWAFSIPPLPHPGGPPLGAVEIYLADDPEQEPA